MKFRTFAAFIAPSVLMMMIFIAAPLVSVFIQSFYQTQPIVDMVQVETCTPGFVTQTCVTETKPRPTPDDAGKMRTETNFIGWQRYGNVLEPAKARDAIRNLDPAALLAIDFWGALRFMLTFTFITLPLVIGLGLAIAIVVNNTARSVRGPVIFVSLLPFIITPVIGALAIRWLFVGDGIRTRAMEHYSGTDIAIFAQGRAIEILMMFFRVWHVAPFAFVIFYAGL